MPWKTVLVPPCQHLEKINRDPTVTLAWQNRSVEPLTILAGTLELSHELEAWTLSQPEPDGAQRRYTASVRFEHAFRQPPVVHTGLSGFDISNDDAARLHISTSGIGAHGFDVIIETSLGTRVWSVSVAWLALGA